MAPTEAERDFPGSVAEPRAQRTGDLEPVAGHFGRVVTFVPRLMHRHSVAMGVWIAASTAGVGAAIAGGYVGVVTGALAIDLGVGRRTRALRPQTVKVDTPREEVFDVIAAGYLARQPKAAADKIRVIERGTDMVLASHRTPVRGRLWQPRSRRSGSPGRAGGLPAGPWPGTARCRAVHPDRYGDRHHPELRG